MHVLIGSKMKVIFASTKKLYCNVICIFTTSKVKNNSAFIRMTDFFVEMKIK